jgi:hypothetical protein
MGVHSKAMAVPGLFVGRKLLEDEELAVIAAFRGTDFQDYRFHRPLLLHDARPLGRAPPRAPRCARGIRYLGRYDRDSRARERQQGPERKGARHHEELGSAKLSRQAATLEARRCNGSSWISNCGAGHAGLPVARDAHGAAVDVESSPQRGEPESTVPLRKGRERYAPTRRSPRFPRSLLLSAGLQLRSVPCWRAGRLKPRASARVCADATESPCVVILQPHSHERGSGIY